MPTPKIANVTDVDRVWAVQAGTVWWDDITMAFSDLSDDSEPPHRS